MSTKMIAAIIAAVIIFAAIAGSIMYVMVIGMGGDGGNGNGDETPDDTPSFGYGYIGAIVPSSYIGTGTRSSSYYFVGHQAGQTPEQMVTFEVSSTTAFSDITGGKFNFTASGSSYVLDKVVSSGVDDVDMGNMSTIISSLFTNIEVSFTSLSLVYGGYSFGIGTTGTNDYIWVAPKKSYPTFFNDVSVKGTVFDEKALEALAENYAFSIFGEIDLGKITDLAQSFSFTFNGASTKFIVVSDLTYDKTQQVTGDVIDTITPADIDRLASSFSNGGSEWVKDVVGEIGQGIAIFTEQGNTVENTKLWFLLYSIDDYASFPGICNIQLSKSDLTNLTTKVTGLSASSFNLDLPFEINVGIILDATPATYAKRSVTGAWTAVETPPFNSMVESAEIEGYGIVVDLDTLIQSLSEAFEIPETAVKALKTFTTFKNPAVVLMIDEKFPEMLEGTGTPFWKYSSMAIIPDYDTTASGFRYLNLKGVVYDPAMYFNINTELSHIPLMVVDSYSEVTAGLQNVTVKDLKDGNVTLNSYGWAYVNLDAITIGTSLKTLLEKVPPSTPIAGQIAMAVKASPLDACAYNAIKIENLSAIYQVPVFYLATMRGPTYVHLNITNIRGMYIDYQASIDNLNANLTQLLQAPTLPTLDDSLVALGLSEISAPINDFFNDILDSGLTPPGYILAFSIDEISNTPPLVTIDTPLEGSIVGNYECEITLEIQDNPDVALWAEIRILRGGINIYGFDVPVLTTVIKNGYWSTLDSENQLWWSLIQPTLLPGEYTIKVKVHDFKGYSNEIVRNFTVSSIPQIVTSDYNSIDWKPDGSYALIVGDGGIVATYDGNRVEVIKRGLMSTPALPDLPIITNFQDISWRPDGSYALIVGDDNTVYKYEVTLGVTTFTQLLTGVGFNYDWTVVSWKPDGSYALIASWGHIIKFNPLGIPLVNQFTEISSSVWATNDICWKPDGSYALIGGYKQPIRKYDGTTFTNVDANTYDAFGIDWKPGGSYALVVTLFNSTNSFYKYDGTTMIGLGNAGYPYYPYISYDVAWRPNGGEALIVGYNYNGATVIKFDGTTFTLIPNDLTKAHGVDWKPNGNYAVIVGSGGGVWIYTP